MPRDKQAILLELLVLRCKKGDKSAFDELVRQWEGRLGYFVRRLVATEEDAWDILQQTWIKAFKGIRSLNDPQRLPTWLYQDRPLHGHEPLAKPLQGPGTDRGKR